MADLKQTTALTGVLVAVSVAWLAQTIGLNSMAQAESMLVPRLGYHSALTKRVYLDFTPPETKKKPTKTEPEKTEPAKTEKPATSEAAPLNTATTQPNPAAAGSASSEPEQVEDEPIPKPEAIPAPDLNGLSNDEKKQRIKEWKEEKDAQEKEYKAAVQLKKMKARKKAERQREKERLAKKALETKKTALNDTGKDDKKAAKEDKKKKDKDEPIKPNFLAKALLGDWEARQRITAKEAANGTFLLIDIRRNRILFNEKAEMNPLTEADVKEAHQKEKKAESERHNRKKTAKADKSKKGSKEEQTLQAIELKAPDIYVIKSYKNKASVLSKALDQSSEQVKAQTNYEGALLTQPTQVTEGVIDPNVPELPANLSAPESQQPQPTDVASADIKPAVDPIVMEDVSPQAIRDNAHRPYFVDFKENSSEGAFDVAVRGSGFRSKDPIWVSKDVYWDALTPMVSDMTKAHCPERPNAVSIERQCMVLDVKTSSVFPGQMHPGHQLVKGGWYTEPPPEAENRIKDTTAISRITTYLVNMYNLNPASYNYLILKGENFIVSAQPDLLDEANWGLQFLLTSQYPDGGFGAGVIRHDVGSTSLVGDYALEPPSVEPTARAIIALAAAAKAYEKNDLSFSVQMVRAADKAWRYLTKGANSQSEQADWIFLASLALSRVSPEAKYQAKAQEMLSFVSKLTPEQQLLIAKPSDTIPKEILEADVSIPPSTHPDVLLPALALLQVGNTKALEKTAQWMSDLYGYDSISLIKDPKFELKSAWTDPLQWMAYKTGEVLTKYSYYSQDRSGIQDSQATDTKAMEAIDAKIAASKERMNYGYSQLKLNVEDRAILAYSLALLNQGASLAELAQVEAAEAKKNKHRKAEPPTGPSRFDELLDKNKVVDPDKQHRIAPPKNN